MSTAQTCRCAVICTSIFRDADLKSSTTHRAVASGRGFTLVELIITLIIMGILTVLATPLLFDALSFSTRGFSDQARAAFQYAQKLAIAQRRNVCVTVTLSSVSLTRAAIAGAAEACSVPVANPTGGGNYDLTAPSSVTLSPPGVTTFDALGATASSANIAVTGDGTFNIIVETTTGYVH